MFKFEAWVILTMAIGLAFAAPRRSVGPGMGGDAVLVRMKHVAGSPGPHRPPQNRQLDAVPSGGQWQELEAGGNDVVDGRSPFVVTSSGGSQLEQWSGDDRVPMNASLQEPNDLLDDGLKNPTPSSLEGQPPCAFGSDGKCINHPEVKTLDVAKKGMPQPIDLAREHMLTQFGQSQPVYYLPTNQMSPDGTPQYMPVPYQPTLQANSDPFEGLPPAMMAPGMVFSTGQQPLMVYPPAMPGLPPQTIQMMPVMASTPDGMVPQMVPVVMNAEYPMVWDPAGGEMISAFYPAGLSAQRAIPDAPVSPDEPSDPAGVKPDEGQKPPGEESAQLSTSAPVPAPESTAGLPGPAIAVEPTMNPPVIIPTVFPIYPTNEMAMGIQPTYEPKPTAQPDASWMMTSPKHMNHAALMKYLDDLHSYFSQSTKLEQIGTSVEGREIKSLIICGNLMECKKRPLLKPKFRFAANIHGDEATGRGLVVYLAQYLLTNRDSNARVSRLLQTTEIHIVPTLNPDGFETAFGEYSSGVKGKDVSKGRRNANDKDINRAFPHIFNFSSPDDPGFWTDRQPEALAYMNQSVNELFVISGNIHTGDLIISIPLDSHRGDMKPTNYEARPPDYDLFLHIAKVYSYNHPDMHRDDHVCPHTMTSFPDGVVNGAAWYVVTDSSTSQRTRDGSAGDFVYKFANALELTMELSCQKFVEESSFPAEWNKNRDAMISLMEQSHLGVKGLVRHADSLMPVPFAQVEIRSRRQITFANARGEYFRLLLDGHYEIRARNKLYPKPTPWIPFDVFNINGPTIVNIDFVFPT